ncbi:MAG: FtsX-like permease family protein [Bacteroidales bacterium]|jgi:ABC-type lipoprotein release transport system permease subunit
MLAIRLAFKNLLGAGLRTWLNAFVLSLALVMIVFQMGFIQGWNLEARKDTTEWDIGGGEYWHSAYDPYDVLSLNDAHGSIPAELKNLYDEGKAAPVLVTQAAIFPEGRMKNILLKGIDAGQKVIKIPASSLASDSASEPQAIIGTRMASMTGLKKGDLVTIRWRDAKGTFDATDIRIAEVFHTNVPSIDNSQIWISLHRLQKMTGMPENATYIILAQDKTAAASTIPGWIFRDHEYLLRDIDSIIKSKSIAGIVIYILLLSLALLAVFDTQVLSIFRREKEIGTYIALGMTRWQVVGLFTLEGAMNSVLSIFLAAIWGTPVLWIVARAGYSLPKGTEGYGLTMAEKIFPAYGIGTIISMALIVMVTTTIVSFIPSRKIAGMKPTEALRGKSL